MANDKSGSGKADRQNGSGSEGYEVACFAKGPGIALERLNMPTAIMKPLKEMEIKV
jgi:hypothetical protein